MTKRILAALALTAILLVLPSGAQPAMPRYNHIFVIVEENESVAKIIGNPSMPVMSRLAKTYGFATNFYGIRHPSEPNYVALVGGDTFGIADDDAYYCV